uniref:N(6)-L-threonylcarbamoyladenine synthase n=1 Tax=Crassostrea virginica TaxID=6565 RepID=A0A8B8C0V4_CRAVI|nr:probable tRNA N6-adenosine threonylcarbamoyltransferase, mitochondrial [Crassostrea virginica]
MSSLELGIMISRRLSFSANRAICIGLRNLRREVSRNFHLNCQHLFKSKVVLGIETSCDDTGAAVVNTEGAILGDALHSQMKIHKEEGGINPKTAKILHKEQIEKVVSSALQRAGMALEDLDAIAVTVEPGLALSLGVGVNYAKELVEKSRKPMIPIHHMQAHALTARMLNKIEFPFLVLLASGGHCLLTVAQDVDRFLILGDCLDSAPGDCLEKVARCLSLKSIPELQNLCGGAAIEQLAVGGDPHAFPFTKTRTEGTTCDFSFSGVRSQAESFINSEREKEGKSAGEVINQVQDFCASLQYVMAFQIGRRLQRAFVYCEIKNLLPSHPTLVVSGGVASNQYFRHCLRHVCDMNSATLICPPQELCTDNGIMVAWNGVEKLKVGRGISKDPQSEEFRARSPIGENMREDVMKLGLKIPKLKLQSLRV